MVRLIAFAAVSAITLCGQVSVLTWHNDNARTGQNLQETFLTPANVNSATFGRIATLTVDGKVDAQPLYVPSLVIPSQGVHNVLYVATEHGSLYAFDADTFVQLLKVSLLGAGETPAAVSCTQITPEIGITGTPAIDLGAGPNGIIFVVSQSQDASKNFHHRLHALDLLTLTEQFGGPVNITATYPGSGAENTFVPSEHVARPALLVSNGVVYTSWGSHCDSGAYAGWVMGYSETTLAQVGVLNVVPNGNDGGIWSAGSGPAADMNGNIYTLIGNGTFDGSVNTSGFPTKGDYGNSLVKISTSGALSVVDYFTMSNSVAESNADTDFGSAGLVLLPPLDNGKGTGTMVSLAVGAGKDHNIYVLDQNNLGKFNSTLDNIYQQLTGALPGGTWSSPAWFNGNLYYAGAGDNLRRFTFASGAFSLTANSSASFSFPGSTPSISAHGTSNGIVWAMQNSNPAILHAYDAATFPTELYNSNQAAGGRDHFGAGNKYIVPTIVNGRVYVGTTTGVGVFGLFPSISISKSHTGNFTQGQLGATYTLTVSNAAGVSATTGTVTVTDAIPTGLTLSGMSGSGWSCPAGGNTCTRSDALAASSSYPPITVTVNVASSAPASVINSATVAGGGDSTTTNKTATDPTTITTSGAPSAPALVYPGNGAAGIALKPALGWMAASGATSYDVYFGTSSTPPFLANTAGTTYSPGMLSASTLYSWRIVAKNSVGSTSSAVWSFTTGAGVQGSIGVFRNGQWWLDGNGDFSWTGPPDRVFYLGQAGDIAIMGDWDNTGVRRAGVFRNGQWWLDMNNDGQWDSVHDIVFSYGQAGDIPVVGDWDGTGIQRIGVFRNGQWWLDMNGDHVWDAAHDIVFSYGQSGDVPIVGDWDNTGLQRIGVFRSGQWWLDMNNDHVWDAVHDAEFSYGMSGDVPVIGDWTHSGQTRIGVVRQSQWWLDMNGDHVWDSVHDRVVFFGLSTDQPVIAP